MKKLTLAGFKRLFKKSLIDAGYSADWDLLANTLKVGKAAREHTGSERVQGYLATEGSEIGRLYYNSNRKYWLWYEKLSDALNSEYGVFMESINSCEIALFRSGV